MNNQLKYQENTDATQVRAKLIALMQQSVNTFYTLTAGRCLAMTCSVFVVDEANKYYLFVRLDLLAQSQFQKKAHPTFSIK